ncbi:receptor-like protein kinase 7 [Malania oleifera]|uniref:receptor-like protein kinase 7 n=1 Tax=Malania oleifera TaxID=397392 RepID=UPI0025AE4D8C|nr:receptor-like protein kinase 7 [Malania oleifera]
MWIRRRENLLRLVFLCSLCFLCLIYPVKPDELQILLEFKSAFDKSSSNVFGSWEQHILSCNFTGIVCNSDGLVREINLPGEELVGVVPFDSICGLKSLEKISLESNSLNGSITEGLRNCTRLQYLDLSKNFISGEVPDLSTLRDLKFLNLNGSAFSGIFPWKSLQNLTNLTFLSLGDNPFDWSPFPLEVLKLEKLSWLYLTNCSLEGQIPEGIGNLTKLKNLELSDNQLFGEIPMGITKLVNLWQLELYNNQLTGKLPTGFGNLTSLVNFDASQNRLEGDLSELKLLRNLSSLQLFENQLSGKIPEEFGEFENLVELSLYTNKLSGSLPRKLGSWANFMFIDISENFLTGSIPPDMCKNGQMTDLLLLQNKLTGGIPATYSNCLSLVRLRVNNNSLSGTVPAGIWRLPNLSIIDLTLNQFEGPVTNDIGSANSLAQIFLANNRFSGELPAALSKASSLVSIGLSSNQFSGEIPANMGKLKSLNSLHLEGNMFSGAIPDSLGSCASLNDINLAGNSLSGEIPASLGSLPSLNSLNLSNNELSGGIPASLASLKLSLLDLSNNRLTGRIPDSLSIEAYKVSFSGNPGLCSQSVRNFPPCSFDSRKSSSLKTFISCFISGTIVLLVSLGCFLFMKLRAKDRDGSVSATVSWDMKPFHVVSFTEQEIINSIKQENLIGKGGSGNVYKVALKNGNVLAVKHIWRSYSTDQKNGQSSAAMLTKQKGRLPEYDAEVETLSSIRHVNVVKLYCSISSEDSSLLVYEYLPNGSLWDRLHTCQKMKMGWEVRYDIAVGAARGLEYLHHGCDRPVIHRDVKSSNILLDEHLKPKIADFGLAKIMQANGCWHSTEIIAGTHGYIAPEYAYTYKVNEKSDVYSFGVILMELVTGKRPSELEYGENKDIVFWIWSKIGSKEDVLDAVDSDFSEAQKEDAIKVLRIAVQCTAKFPALRPSMRMVVQMLEEAVPCKLAKVSVKIEGEK